MHVFECEKNKKCLPKDEQVQKNHFFSKCASQLSFDFEMLNMNKSSPEVATDKKLGSIKELAATFHDVKLNIDI